jgi:hypothetical protein
VASVVNGVAKGRRGNVAHECPKRGETLDKKRPRQLRRGLVA